MVGITKKSYAKYRINGDFDTVVNNVKLLQKTKKKRPIVQVQFLVFRHNPQDLNDLAKLCDEFSVDTLDLVKGDWTYNQEYLTDLDVQEKETVSKKCISLWNKLVVHWDGGISPCPISYKKKQD